MTVQKPVESTPTHVVQVRVICFKPSSACAALTRTAEGRLKRKESTCEDAVVS